jgi:DNA polymerase III delta prime subunit
MMLWTETYRPLVIDDVVLPAALKDQFKQAINSNNIQNMLFTGTGGIGKTTVAKIICKALKMDYLFINGSEESGIDVLRTKIKHFASTVSLSGGIKVVIIDEADYLNAQSTQPALRAFMEEFHKNCRFILTCNYKDRIIPELHSRCAVFDFNITKADRPALATQIFRRIKFILENENVTIEDDKVVAELITRYIPDWRRVINELQRYSASGIIDKGILHDLSDDSVSKLIKYLKEKNFKAMRSWVSENADMGAEALYRKIFDNMSLYAVPNSTPTIVLILAEYQYKAAFVADVELNTVACLTELMSGVEWK